MAQKKAVLIVEDDKVNLKILKKIIEPYIDSLIIHFAENGKDAIELYKSHPKQFYYVIFMDLHLPDINGHKITKIIKNFDNKQKIIGITSETQHDALQKFIKSGLDDLISNENKAKAFNDCKNIIKTLTDPQIDCYKHIFQLKLYDKRRNSC